MRVDKYLWCIRVFKTRSLATASCKAGKVTINEVSCKPAREVKVGEEVVIRKGAVHFSFKIKAIPPNRVGAKLVEEYCKDTTPQEELEKLEMIKLSYRETIRRKPGRPSKKDRRDLDEFFGT